MLESSIFFNECAMFFPVTFNSVCVHFENKNKQAICIKAYILFKMYIFYFIYQSCSFCCFACQEYQRKKKQAIKQTVFLKYTRKLLFINKIKFDVAEVCIKIETINFIEFLLIYLPFVQVLYCNYIYCYWRRTGCMCYF